MSASVRSLPAPALACDARSLFRVGVLYLFALAHMQDVEPILCPAALFLVILAFLPDIRLYRHQPSAFLPMLGLVIYLPALLWIHNNIADGTAFTLLLKSAGRVVYVMSVCVVFAHIRPTVNLAPLVSLAAILAAATNSVPCLYSYFISSVSVWDRKLSGAVITGLLETKGAQADMLGTYLVIAATDLLHYFEFRNDRRWPRLLMLLAFPVLLAFVFCKCRTWVLALGAVFVVVAIRIVQLDRRTLGAIGLALAGLIVAAGISHLDREKQPQGSESIEFRLTMWDRAIRRIVQSPLIGTGIGTFEQKHVQLHTVVPNLIALRMEGELQAPSETHDDPNGGMNTHNSYLMVWTDFGLIGMLFYLWLLRELVVRSRFVLGFDWQSLPDGPTLQRGTAWFVAVAGLTLLYMLVGGMAEGYVFYGPNAPLYLMIAFGRLIATSEWLRSLTPSPSP
ncbi:MAG TPA: O-antigen ligase family protein [Planctomycetaceae bacterium]|nr:O-antigen ligase family protein [Planctomycetaceae bacterium]